MLIGVLTGFAPTFFLRETFHQPALPWWIVVHGLAQSAWYVLFCIQSALIVSRRVGWHRRVGWLTVGVAVLVVATAPLVVLRSVPRGLAAGQGAIDLSFIVLSDALRIPFFAVMVGVAVVQRRKKDVHTRAMLLGSLSNFAPAASRLAMLAGGNPLLGALLYTVTFGIALVRFDRRTLRHVHPLTGWGLVCLFLLIGIPIVLVAAGISQPLVDALR